MNNVYTLELKNPDGKLIEVWEMDLDEGDVTAQMPLDSEEILNPIYDDEYERMKND